MIMDTQPGKGPLVAEITSYAAKASKGSHRCHISTCPHCGQRPSSPPFFRRHALRARTFLVIEDRCIHSVACVLVRWRCSACNRTFTEYPPFAVPYKRYALAQIVPRALWYVENDGVSYRKGVLEARLPIFHWPSLGDGVDHWTDNESVLAHSTLYHWVSTLGGPAYAIPGECREDVDQSFSPAGWKFTTKRRRETLMGCRQCCHLIGLLTNSA
jgi:hypothetical protein